MWGGKQPYLEAPIKLIITMMVLDDDAALFGEDAVSGGVGDDAVATSPLTPLSQSAHQ